MTKGLFVVALAALLSARAGFAATYQIDPVHSYVGFSISHLLGHVPGAFKKFEGTIELEEGALEKMQIEATIDAASIDTRVERRDTDLRSDHFFDVGKYPTITFTSKSVKVKGKNQLLVKGDFALHGVTKPVTLNGTYNGQTKDPWGGTRIAFTATTKINRRDFGMTYGQILNTGLAVIGDGVSISLEIEGVLKK